MEALEEVGQRISVNWTVGNIRAASLNDIDPEWDEFRKTMLLATDSALWYSTRKLLDRPWFSRLWIWQEVSLAKNDVSLLCGLKEIDYRHFSNAIDCYYLNRLESRGLRQAHRIGRQSSMNNAATFTDLIYKTRDCQCSDKRDRIFALLNLLNNSDQSSIKPDYSKSEQEVLQALIIQQAKYQGSLQLLTLCSPLDTTSNMPAWSNWFTPTTLQRVQVGCANAGARAQVHSVSNGVLVATGVYVASIDQIGSRVVTFSHELKVGDTWDNVDTAKAIANLEEVIGSVDPAITNSKIESLCRTIFRNIFSDNFIPHTKIYPDFQGIVQHMTDYLKSSLEGSIPKSVSYMRFARHVLYMMHGGKLIKTSNGSFCFGPRDIRVGDIVCVILGCSIPLILRHDGASCYTIVGECFVDGIMTGEALLGKLPGNWSFVHKWFPQFGSYHYVFLNSETGDTQIEDPRLGPLPAGWRNKNMSNKELPWNWYVNIDTGEVAGIRDPRMTVDALKARGVILRDFKLI